MRIFTINGHQVAETDDLAALGDVRCARAGLCLDGLRPPRIRGQHRVRFKPSCRLCAALQLVDLHISDLLNKQLPSRYDYTSQYDVLVFRRLAAGTAEPAPAHPAQAPARAGQTQRPAHPAAH